MRNETGVMEVCLCLADNGMFGIYIYLYILGDNYCMQMPSEDDSV